jgi:hypothetical protein
LHNVLLLRHKKFASQNKKSLFKRLTKKSRVTRKNVQNFKRECWRLCYKIASCIFSGFSDHYRHLKMQRYESVDKIKILDPRYQEQDISESASQLVRKICSYLELRGDDIRSEVARRYYVRGKPISEISAELSLGMNTVLFHIHQVRQEIREHFRGDR